MVILNTKNDHKVVFTVFLKKVRAVKKKKFHCCNTTTSWIIEKSFLHLPLFQALWSTIATWVAWKPSKFLTFRCIGTQKQNLKNFGQRQGGCTCPILPGVLPSRFAVKGLWKFTSHHFCKLCSCKGVWVQLT